MNFCLHLCLFPIYCIPHQCTYQFRLLTTADYANHMNFMQGMLNCSIIYLTLLLGLWILSQLHVEVAKTDLHISGL